MQQQLNLFTGPELRDKGMKKVLEHAERVSPNWGERAYQFLLEFAKSNRLFMAEDVREKSQGVVDPPPSKRAWGPILRRAAISGIIKKVGHQQVKNAKAHCTPAAVWESLTINA